jgi:peptidoglycan/xylan/chitin deacetylase (PgdA/CDA1 family)
MRYLAEHYHVVSLTEALAAVIDDHPLPPKSVLVTFDDGYRDFAEHAWPVLQRHRLPVTVFIPTAFPDQPDAAFWWDRLYCAVQSTNAGKVETPECRIEWGSRQQKGTALRKMVSLVKSLPDRQAQQVVNDICSSLGSPAVPNPTLGWDELSQLAAAGVTLAPHTRRHPLLNRVDVARAREEIAGSLADLQTRIPNVPPVLAYPSGAYSQSVVELLPELGIQLAFTTCRGLNDLNRLDRFRVRRINIGRRTSPALLRTQLLPWTVHLNRWSPLPDSVT